MTSNYNSIETIASQEYVTGQTQAAGQRQLAMRDKLGSLMVADSIVKTILDKVAHVEYMKEIEEKVRPYVINYSTLQGLEMVEILNLKADGRCDDKYLSQECRDEDCQEPANLGRDTMAPCEDVKIRPTVPTVQLESTSPAYSLTLKPTDHFLNRKNSKTSKNSKGSSSQGKRTASNLQKASTVGVEQYAMAFGKNKTGFTLKKESSANNPEQFSHTSTQFDQRDKLSAKGIAHKKNSTARSLADKMINESTSDVISRLDSRDSNVRRTNRMANVTNQFPQEYYQAQCFEIDWKPPKINDEDASLEEKLAELRVEVQKRDIQRKFEAIHTQQTKKFGGRMSSQNNPLMAGAPSGSNITTDHNGNLLQVRSGAIALQQPMSTTVKISSQTNVPRKLEFTLNPKSQQQQPRKSKIDREINIHLASSNSNLSQKPASQIRSSTDTLVPNNVAKKKVNADDDDENEIVYRNAEQILGNTASSSFGHKRNKKEFNQLQTVDYQKSIQMNQLGDGVSFRGGQGGARHGLSHMHSNRLSSRQQLNPISHIGSKQSLAHKMHSQQVSQIQRPPFSSHLEQASFISNSPDHHITPNTSQVRRSMVAVDYALSPNSVDKEAHSHILANYSSEVQLMTEDTQVLNSSIISGQSRYDKNFPKSKSRVRQPGRGKITQNNSVEVASFLADGLQEMQSRIEKSRQDAVSSNDPQLVNIASADHQRESSISRMLAKQSSENRLRAREGKNSISSTLLSSKTHRQNMLNSSHQLAQQDNFMPTEESRILSSGGNNQTTTNPNGDSSFSYLPSISGVYRSKLQSGSSADILAGNRRRYGPHSTTGKTPLLMASYRRMQLGDGGKIKPYVGNVKLVDPSKVKEMIRERSMEKKLEASDAVSSKIHASAKRIQILRKGMDYIAGTRGTTSESKHSVGNTIQSANSRQGLV